MNPYKKAARFVLRVIAFGLLLIGGLNVTIELFRRHEMNLAAVVLNSLAFLAGAVLFLFSGKLADKIADRLEG